MFIAWAIVGAIAGIGFIFILITNEYIQKPLRRQRQIMATVWSSWWLETLGIMPTRSKSIWRRRLDLFDVSVFAIVAVVSFIMAILHFL